MNILALDTTEEALSVALEAGGRVYSLDRKLKTPHDETLIPAVDKLLAKAKIGLKDLDAVAAANGPGRFTGIRVGMACAVVAAGQLGVPALAVTRFEGTAYKREEKDVCAVIEGFRGEKYYQLFRSRRPKGQPVWVSADQWVHTSKELARQGWTIVQDVPRAKDLLAPAKARLSSKRIPKFEPLYLKPASYERPPSVVR